LAALVERRNTLGVAPTGAGKTVMLSTIAGRALVGNSKRALVLQHRDELVAQNRRAFHKVNPGLDSGVVDADTKQFQRQVTFAMVPTLSRANNLDALPPQDLIVADEAHHVMADSWRKIIDAVRQRNPQAAVLGVTATPMRGDGVGLIGVFDNVCDQITLGELIHAGHLVRPRTFVVDIGVQSDLKNVKRQKEDFDMDAVASIMDREILNDEIVKHWKEKAGGRRTVVFCSTVAHAQHVATAFKEAGVSAAVVSGNTPDGERRTSLEALARGDTQVVCNVAVLTEGWDCPPVSCVILLRPSSYKSTMIQMIGRGLRTVDQEKFPGIEKHDCIVLDFGISTLLHGSLEQDVNLEGKDNGGEAGEAPKKTCPSCSASVPISCRECPVCGAEFPPPLDLEPEPLKDFAMSEVDIFEASPFKWVDLWNDGVALMAAGFDTWALVINFRGQWRAIGGSTSADGGGVRSIAYGDKLLCLAQADDYMREHTDGDQASKSRRWLSLPATDKQLEHLGYTRLAGTWLTRYHAACRLTWKFNERAIKTKLFAAPVGVAA
jgi:superfamily II DNA or RNA helicase